MALSASSMASKIKAHIDAVAKETNLGDASARRDAVTLALCQGIIDEIVANSELVPLTTDGGTAGSGIITGKVK